MTGSAPDPHRRDLTVGIGVLLTCTAVLAVAWQAISFRAWPGGDRDLVPAGIVWWPRALALVGTALVLGAGVALTSWARRRSNVRAFPRVVGALLSLPLAGLASVSVNQLAEDHVNTRTDEWAASHRDQILAQLAPAPPAPSPDVAAVLWTPARTETYNPAVDAPSQTRPTACAASYGATAAGRQAGTADGLLILETAHAFPTPDAAAAYVADPHACGVPSGADVENATLPPVLGAATQTAWRTVTADGTVGHPRLLLQVDRFVLSAMISSSPDSARAVTDSELHDVASLLTRAATD